jgi:hypothetical protein
MNGMRLGLRWAKLALISVMAAAAAGGLASTSEAATGCGTRTVTTPFSRFGDANSYFLAPNGGFESGATNWSLSGGATVASGNESFYLRSTSDRYSLSLPTGAVASSSFVCITKDDPSVRFVARATGSIYTSLNVSATIRSSAGTVQTVYLGQLSAGSFASWTPSSIYSYAVNLNMPGMIVNGVAEISFSFSSQGSGGSWQIDDVYIDPFKGT